MKTETAFIVTLALILENRSTSRNDVRLFGVTCRNFLCMQDALVVYGHWQNTVLNENGLPIPFRAGNTIGIDSIHHGVVTAQFVSILSPNESRRTPIACAAEQRFETWNYSTH